MKRGRPIVSVGGWYQRTTLHLSEIHGFLAEAFSKLPLDNSKLKSLQKNLDLKEVSREMGNLEFVRATTQSGIEVRYYEDGLYVLHMEAKDVDKTKKLLEDYLQNKLQPAMDYLFSIGAPTPKILANLKIEHPVVVSTQGNTKTLKVDKKFGNVYSKISSKDLTLIKTRGYIFLVSSSRNSKEIESLVETQIFFREFKDQLERYLDIHRKMWKSISEIKEKKFLKGSELGAYSSQLQSYKETIKLIRSRINQMDIYARTRQSLAKTINFEEDLKKLFQYRFEDLFNTLDYIKEVWSITDYYVDSGLKMVSSAEGIATSKSIRSIQVLASIGVVGGFLGYLTRDSLPTLSKIGLVYLISLIVIAFIIDKGIKAYYKNKKYGVSMAERSKDI